MIPEDIIPNTGKLQAFIKDEALNSIFNVMHIILLFSLNREFDYSKPSLISLFFSRMLSPAQLRISSIYYWVIIQILQMSIVRHERIRILS